MLKRASSGWPQVHKAIVIGCSAGGVQALSTLLGGLAQNLPAPVIVVCHMGSEDTHMFCDILNHRSRLPVTEALERHPPVMGTVYIAPASYHLLIERDGCFALSVDDRVCFCRPAIDVLFCSASAYYRQHLIGVVLTGANDDGSQGLKAIRQRGGLGIVQTPDSAEAKAMPESAIRIAGADHIVSLPEIAPHLNQLFGC